MRACHLTTLGIHACNEGLNSWELGVTTTLILYMQFICDGAYENTWITQLMSCVHEARMIFENKVF